MCVSFDHQAVQWNLPEQFAQVHSTAFVANPARDAKV
jgi:hypothetical protein